MSETLALVARKSAHLCGVSSGTAARIGDAVPSKPAEPPTKGGDFQLATNGDRNMAIDTLEYS